MKGMKAAVVRSDSAGKRGGADLGSKGGYSLWRQDRRNWGRGWWRWTQEGEIKENRTVMRKE